MYKHVQVNNVPEVNQCASAGNEKKSLSNANWPHNFVLLDNNEAKSLYDSLSTLQFWLALVKSFKSNLGLKLTMLC